MLIQENIPLSAYSTMRLGGKARYLVNIVSREEIQIAISWANEHNLSVVMIGGGSNIFWSDEGFDGLVLVNQIKGFDIYKENDFDAYVTVGAGENWDEVVDRVVKAGYSGIEALSLIPGNAGAAPVQNIGAYGTEIASTLTTIEAYDRTENKLVTLRASDCELSYRNSRFKTSDKGRFLITSITLHVTRSSPIPPFYKALSSYFMSNNITEYSPKVVRDAVIAIRNEKLPNPSINPNNGSFFTNPIIPKNTLAKLLPNYPTISYWEQPDNNVKISAAWLVEQSGFKDFHDSETGFGTWAKQPLVIVNEGAVKTSSLLEFSEKIVSSVKQKFDITLTREPELINN